MLRAKLLRILYLQLQYFTSGMFHKEMFNRGFVSNMFYKNNRKLALIINKKRFREFFTQQKSSKTVSSHK